MTDYPPLTFGQSFRGHYLTLKPFFARTIRKPSRPESERFDLEIEDPQVGPVQLSGEFFDAGSDDLVVGLHGLGGNTASPYMGMLASAALQAGKSCLLLNARGADRSGTDIHHSGLSLDVEHCLASPRLASFSQVYLFGYSIGGHVALKYACGEVDPRVRRIAAVGSPLHLAEAADDFDRSGFNVYRTHIMDSLKEIYTAAYQRRPQGTLPHEAREIGKIRVWDEKVIAPRFGFESAEAYYESESVANCLDELQVESLYVGAECDPMVLSASVKPHLDRKARGKSLDAVWDKKSGHIGFAKDFSLGLPGPAGLEAQVLSWLSR